MKFKKQTYLWLGTYDQGKQSSGEIHAFSMNLAKLELIRRGVNPTVIRKKSYTWFNQKIGALDMVVFFRQLATLVTSGVPLLQGCEILQRAQNNKSIQKLIIGIKNEIESGKGLAQGLRQFPRYFDHLTYHLVHVGEHTGTLEIMLRRIADHKEQLLKLKNKIKQALFYPCIITLVAMVVTTLMLTYIVPRFAELFQATHHPLPAFTLSVIHLANFFRSYGWVMLLPIFGLLVLPYYARTSEKIRQHFDYGLLKLPYINPLIRKIILARIAKNLATTVAAGILITDALQMIAPTTGNHFYTRALLILQAHITQGRQLHEAMQMNPLFPAMLVQMVKIGEETGMLDHLLEKFADITTAEVEHAFSVLSQVIEPLILLILGVLIGGLIIAMYLPIFKIGMII
jgi:type IV pilus assembly protein PilC